MNIFPILFDANGSQKSEMAAHKPEILISQSVYNIGEKCQSQNSCFQSPGVE